MSAKPPSKHKKKHKNKDKKSEDRNKEEKFETDQFTKKISIDESKVLGLGSGGTVVFQGELNGREIAVKRMLL